jgi:hypothetical protein
VVEAASDFADEGTACHELAERAMLGEDIEKLVGKKAEIGLTFTAGMLDLVRPCVEWVRDYADATGAVLHLEEKVEIGLPAFGLPEGLLWGTSDVIGSTLSERLVLDYKFGYRPVEVKKNPQAILYGLGANAKFGPLPRTRLVIVQPRCGDPTEVVYTPAEMEDFREEFKPKVIQASKGGALNPGPWCDESFCKARAVCPAMKDEMLALAQREFANPLAHTPEELADLLDKVEMIESAASALRAHAMKLDELGTKIPGWKRVKGDTKRKWLGDEEATAAGLKKMGVDPYEKCLVSPAGAESQLVEVLVSKKVKGGEKIATKKAAKELAKDLLKKFAGKPEGKPVLVREEDPREALPPEFTLDDVRALEAAEVAAVVEID